jgi:hypothetical protein
MPDSPKKDKDTNNVIAAEKAAIMDHVEVA